MYEGSAIDRRVETALGLVAQIQPEPHPVEPELRKNATDLPSRILP